MFTVVTARAIEWATREEMDRIFHAGKEIAVGRPIPGCHGGNP